MRALLDEDADLRSAVEAKVVEFLGLNPKEFKPTAEEMDEGVEPEFED